MLNALMITPQGWTRHSGGTFSVPAPSKQSATQTGQGVYAPSNGQASVPDNDRSAATLPQN
jgi:hypothetical protein